MHCMNKLALLATNLTKKKANYLQQSAQTCHTNTWCKSAACTLSNTAAECVFIVFLTRKLTLIHLSTTIPAIHLRFKKTPYYQDTSLQPARVCGSCSTERATQSGDSDVKDYISTAMWMNVLEDL